MIFVYITCKDKKEAFKISKMLLDKKLIACANIYPIISMFRWKNKIQNNQEIVLLVKTLENKYKSIKKEVEKIHSYETPCILKIKVKGNNKFEKWVKEEVKK